MNRRYSLQRIALAAGGCTAGLAALFMLATSVQAGHEPDINPALRRFTGMVVAVGKPDPSGHVHSFRVQPLGPGVTAPVPDELRGWRLTVLAGKRFASVYVVQSNSADEITVRGSDGPLDGLAPRDVFVVEEIDDKAVPVSRLVRRRVMRLDGWAALFCAGLLTSATAHAQAGRLPADAVDGFHAALKKKDTALALSFLDRSLVVFEYGSADPTIESYALRHLPRDIDMAAIASWTLQTRRVGGEGNERWLLSSYRVQGMRPDGRPIDQITQETAIVRRAGDGFRIVHLHWSTDNAEFQAWVQSQQPPP